MCSYYTTTLCAQLLLTATATTVTARCERSAGLLHRAKTVFVVSAGRAGGLYQRKKVWGPGPLLGSLQNLQIPHSETDGADIDQ
jgi:hypothetical protein